MSKYKKEDALTHYIIMIKKSWTFSRLTENEKRHCLESLSNCDGKLYGNFRQRHQQLNNVYYAFISALDYSENPINWRKENANSMPLF